MEKPIKSKPELFLFLGFVVLSISFLAMIWFFNNKSNELKRTETELKIREIALKSKETSENFLIKKFSDSSNNKMITESVNMIKSQANVEISRVTQSNSPIYIQVGSEITKNKLSSLDFISRISSLNYNVVDEYDLELNRADNTIRYFNMNDRKIATELSEDISKEFPEIILATKYVKFSTVKIPEGQLEIWIK